MLLIFSSLRVQVEYAPGKSADKAITREYHEILCFIYIYTLRLRLYISIYILYTFIKHPDALDQVPDPDTSDL